MLHESGLDDLDESIGPFLECLGCDDDLIAACGAAVMECAESSATTNGGDDSNGIIDNRSNDDMHTGAVKLKGGIVSMSLNDQSEAEMDIWGEEK